MAVPEAPSAKLPPNVQGSTKPPNAPPPTTGAVPPRPQPQPQPSPPPRPQPPAPPIERPEQEQQPVRSGVPMPMAGPPMAQSRAPEPHTANLAPGVEEERNAGKQALELAKKRFADEQKTGKEVVDRLSKNPNPPKLGGPTGPSAHDYSDRADSPVHGDPPIPRGSMHPLNRTELSPNDPARGDDPPRA